MTQRSIFAGQAPTVVIKAGADVTVEGWDSERVVAESESRWGLKVEKKSENEIGRARAAVGDHVLFDLHLTRPGSPANADGAEAEAEVIDVMLGASGRVRVPAGSRVKVFAGRGAEVRGLTGSASVVTGGSALVRDVHTLAQISSGGSTDLECDEIVGNEAKFEAGRDFRCCIRSLTSARVLINDMGGFWEARIGSGAVTLHLKAGGDVTLVTDQPVEAQPPDYLLGQIERPGGAPGVQSGEAQAEL